MKEEIVDLYEITIYAECDGVRARMSRYLTKRTQHNFIPLRVTDEMEAQGYSYRLHERVPVANLGRIQRCGLGDGCDHIWRQAYCLAEDREKVFNSMRMEIDLTVRRMHERSQKLLASWELNSKNLKPATKKCKLANQLPSAQVSPEQLV